jgi:hypothetical protein
MGEICQSPCASMFRHLPVPVLRAARPFLTGNRRSDGSLCRDIIKLWSPGFYSSSDLFVRRGWLHEADGESRLLTRGATATIAAGSHIPCRSTDDLLLPRNAFATTRMPTALPLK